ncbi:tetratricopeptide repeat protein [Pseudoalteromonas sp. NZS127_1]|uniref:CDC27 family protein n=1 Tax=unclassified Pseudoalteromonas TaxID=194690 RepID=UPI00040226BC|nr:MULTISPECIES: CDC27 family protein [unclassified Pseudoalteromonas]MBG9994660.1 tetratricopeptide repeat protein [Pseudoalteromonas sp. NZS127_1]MBH0021488.1 tetratricopeptide repeat protein [Pseudoalteromonas sp. SWXJ133]MBH0051257.1 tetratricopeptide repeat protein [Pseudoalteromonas sp. SWYJZ19]
MNHWKILGIEATTDKRLIKLAYTELLKKTSPAEFPQEFKDLRKAYELAIKEAKQPTQNEDKAPNQVFEDEYEKQGVTNESFFDEEAPSSASTEVEIVKPQPIELNCVRSIAELQIALNELYCNVSSRSDVEQWKLLFSAPLFWDVDQSQQVLFTLIDFLSEHYFLSATVFKFLDESIKISSELVTSKNNHYRELAIALHHYIQSLPLRIESPSNIDEDISFEQLHQHLQLRNLIEEQCIYSKLTAKQLMILMQRVNLVFYNDESLYLYVANYLWTLDAYTEISKLVGSLPPPTDASIEHLRDLQAHAEFKLENYDIALTIYLAQRELIKSFYAMKMTKEIGLCYLHLKDYEKAYIFLNSYFYIRPEEIDLRSALIIARRHYIKDLKKNEESNALKIATLQFENGRYQDALITTQTYSLVFDANCNYLQALCLAKLERLDEAFDVFIAFMNLHLQKLVDPWPLLVDLFIYCPDSIDFNLIMETIAKKIQPSPNKFYKTPRVLGSVQENIYSQLELKTLDLPATDHDGKPTKPMGYALYPDLEYKQQYAWAMLHALMAKLVNIENEAVKKQVKQAAIYAIKQAMPKITHQPSWSLKFIHLAFDIDDFDTCIKLVNIAISEFSNLPQAYYYKGRSLAALEQYNEAIPVLLLAADKYGDQRLGIYSLEFAVECCEKLVELGQPMHANYNDICLKLQTTKEIVDA